MTFDLELDRAVCSLIVIRGANEERTALRLQLSGPIPSRPGEVVIPGRDTKLKTL